MPRPSGFTLVELMVTIAVLVVVGGIGVPALHAFVEDARVTRSMHRLTASLALGRIAAISRGVPVSLCPSFDGRQCRSSTDWSEGWIVFLDPARTGQPASERDVLEVGEASGGELTVSSTAGRTLVRFQPEGWSAGYNVTLRLCTDDLVQGRIVLNNAGRARSDRPKTPISCPSRA